MAEFGLIESFDCDDGQLDGLTAAACFVLGYEFASICYEMSAFAASPPRLVHLHNKDRIEKAAKNRGRVPHFKYLHHDVSESWCEFSWQS